jgi:ribonuclease E
MPKEMLINAVEGEECRIAVVQDGALEELYLERASAERHVGNIYKGRVHNVEPSIQAAFVDIGMPKNGFLHSSDVIAAAHPKRLKGPEEAGGRPRRTIQDIFKPGDEVIVQVTKEGIGTKGPSLTTFLSIPGRYLVLMPGLARLGVSRKIEDEPTRKALRELLASLQPPKDLGFVVRTAGQGRSKRDLQADMNYLLRLWEAVQARAASAKAPAEIFRESDLLVRTLRDTFTPDIQTVWVDSEAVLRRARDFMKIAMPRHRKAVKLHEGPGPLFHKYNLEEAIEQVYSRTVTLPRGGTLVIDQTEALVAIDVNSGTFRHSRDPEESALQLDLMAAKEIARQLRLRDLGGVVIIDFVDLSRPENRRKVEKALRDAMKRDRARHRTLKMSPFGIVEMTRQRVQPSLQRVAYMDCPTCRGTGIVKSAASMALDVVRHVQFLLDRDNVAAVEVIVHPDVGDYVNNQQRDALVRLSGAKRKRIRITADPHSPPDRAAYRCLDERGVEVQAALPGPAATA